MDPLRGDEVLVVARVADERPTRAVGLSEEAADGGSREALLARRRAYPLGEARHGLEGLEVRALDVLFHSFELRVRPADDDEREVVVRGPRGEPAALA